MEWDATHRFDPASGNAKVVPTSVLAGADRAFAARMRSAGVLAALAARRAAPAVARPDASSAGVLRRALRGTATTVDKATARRSSSGHPDVIK